MFKKRIINKKAIRKRIEITSGLYIESKWSMCIQLIKYIKQLDGLVEETFAKNELLKNNSFMDVVTSSYFNINKFSISDIEWLIPYISDISFLKYIKYMIEEDIKDTRITEKLAEIESRIDIIPDEIEALLDKDNVLDCWYVFDYFDVPVDISYDEFSSFCLKASDCKLFNDNVISFIKKSIDSDTLEQYAVKYIICNISSGNIGTFISSIELPLSQYILDSLYKFMDIEITYDTTLGDEIFNHTIYNAVDIINNKYNTSFNKIDMIMSCFDEEMYISYDEFETTYKYFEDDKDKSKILKLYMDNCNEYTMKDRTEYYNSFTKLINQ